MTTLKIEITTEDKNVTPFLDAIKKIVGDAFTHITVVETEAHSSSEETFKVKTPDLLPYEVFRTLPLEELKVYCKLHGGVLKTMDKYRGQGGIISEEAANDFLQMIHAQKRKERE